MGNPEIASLLAKIQERLVSLENKIDTLVGKGSPAKLLYSTPSQERVQKPAFTDHGNAGRQENRNRVRPMFKAICADCKNECELPFKPSGDRPVYCQGCFARRKAGNALRTVVDAKPAVTPPAQITQAEEKEPVKKRKPVAKKKPAVKAAKRPAKKRPR